MHISKITTGKVDQTIKTMQMYCWAWKDAKIVLQPSYLVLHNVATNLCTNYMFSIHIDGERLMRFRVALTLHPIIAQFGSSEILVSVIRSHLIE